MGIFERIFHFDERFFLFFVFGLNLSQFCTQILDVVSKVLNSLETLTKIPEKRRKKFKEMKKIRDRKLFFLNWNKGERQVRKKERLIKNLSKGVGWLASYLTFKFLRA
jgi:hypothetical protein